ncbi:MAG TPA: PAS domain-containing sensor histidine kinase [Fulvivirga sp.]|nr:PAS domain-containing sensor histidine kinase [Fulvivirga sp.]
MKPSSNKTQLTLGDQQFRALMEKAHDGIVLYNEEGAIVYASPSVVNIVGYVDHEIIGHLGTDFVHPEDVGEAKKMFAEAAKVPGESISFQQRLIHKKQHSLWVETTLTNLLHDPEVRGIISNFRDITTQKIAEDDLFESKALLESINHNIKEAIYRNLPDRSFEYVNQAFLDMFGYDSLSDLNKINPAILYVDNNVRLKIKNELLSKKSINNVEAEYRRKDGTTFWGLISSTYIIANDGIEYFDGAIRDITNQKIAEEKLVKNEALISSINRNIKEGLYRSSINKGLIYVNDTFAEIFGYSTPKEIIETDINSIYYNPETRKEVLSELILNKTIRNKEVLFKRKSGEKFWALMSSFLIEDKDGNQYFDGAVTDITDIKLAEQQLMELNETLQRQNISLLEREEKLNRTMKELSDRNFELDQLVYKTSHDLRSPLSSILGLVNVAKIDNNIDKLEYINKIGTSIKRLDDFVKSMLNYAKASRVEVSPEKLNIRTIIEGCIKDLEYLENFTKLKVSLNFNKEYFVTDKLKLKIILGNIISNAFKYINNREEQSFLKIDVNISASKMKLMIVDNGIGIEKEHLPKIMDMFYRGTELSQGSGLGMYIVKQSIDKLGGSISINSTSGKGTSIVIELPTKPKK